MKRFFDICFSLVALVLLAPFMGVLALAIRIGSPGPVLYRQKRVGRDGEFFECLKFRTMYEDAAEQLEELLGNSERLKKQWQENFKLVDDPRVTPIGAWMRRYSLDELPQFWNVLKGELSVVGPRPVTVQEIELCYGPLAKELLTIRPGLTGPWQVSGRNLLPYPERVRLDIEYVREQTLLWDLQLICLTLPAMVSGDGAY